MKKPSLSTFLILAFFTAVSPARAACAGPTGTAGDILYSNVNAMMYYCNNTNWIIMGSNVPAGLGSLTTGAFCTAASGSQINCTTGAIGLASQVTGILPVANGGTGATSLTQGSVVFGGSGGVHSQDNGDFFWDAANRRLGIGTGTPDMPLTVAGTIHSTTGGIEFPDGTTQTTAASPASIKAWVNFNGSTGAIRASYNVSSVTRVSAGRYTINFSSAMSDANYAVSLSASGVFNGTVFGTDGVGDNAPAPRSTTSIQIFTTGGNGSSGTYDPAYVNVTIVR